MKLIFVIRMVKDEWSLRSPERGLKSVISCSEYVPEVSLRSPERGLKFVIVLICFICYAVAPFAGAWIEILKPSPFAIVSAVAPFAGAWIEICIFTLFTPFTPSLRSPERGLK